jgi:hypothetical protein
MPDEKRGARLAREAKGDLALLARDHQMDGLVLPLGIFLLPDHLDGLFAGMVLQHVALDEAVGDLRGMPDILGARREGPQNPRPALVLDNAARLVVEGILLPFGKNETPVGRQLVHGQPWIVRELAAPARRTCRNGQVLVDLDVVAADDLPSVTLVIDHHHPLLVEEPRDHLAVDNNSPCSLTRTRSPGMPISR